MQSVSIKFSNGLLGVEVTKVRLWQLFFRPLLVSAKDIIAKRIKPFAINLPLAGSRNCLQPVSRNYMQAGFTHIQQLVSRE
jgi:hypothetical protein